jgi:integrase
MGPPKTEAGTRSIPLPPIVVNTLREWKLSSPHNDANLIFANRAGKPFTHTDLLKRGLVPILLAIGLAEQLRDDQGRPRVTTHGDPIVKGRYTGLHAFRHWYASWCINRKSDGGLELPYKTVQTRLGHSTLAMTTDTYGHLFAESDESGLLAAGEQALLA